jgi:hypothetical protein
MQLEHRVTNIYHREAGSWPDLRGGRRECRRS